MFLKAQPKDRIVVDRPCGFLVGRKGTVKGTLGMLLFISWDNGEEGSINAAFVGPIHEKTSPEINICPECKCEVTPPGCRTDWCSHYKVNRPNDGVLPSYRPRKRPW